MKLQNRRFGRSLWLNLLVINLATCGIYGVNLMTMRKALLIVAVSLLSAAVAYVVTGRFENCGDSAVQR
jgi:hypothetical protein